MPAGGLDDDCGVCRGEVMALEDYDHDDSFVLATNYRR